MSAPLQVTRNANSFGKFALSPSASLAPRPCSSELGKGWKAEAGVESTWKPGFAPNLHRFLQGGAALREPSLKLELVRVPQKHECGSLPGYILIFKFISSFYYVKNSDRKASKLHVLSPPYPHLH